MVTTSVTFSDIQSHWARRFIEILTQRRVFNGYPNGTFRPDNSVTRAEFAAIITSVFSTTAKREVIKFTDVPDSHWAAKAIEKASVSGFLSGYADRTFRPNERIARVDILVSLVNGLEIASKIQPDLLTVLPQIFQDGNAIPSYARSAVAIATKAEIIVNYPNLKILNPNLAATRGDLAAMIYQGLVFQNKVEKIASNYIVTPPANLNNPLQTVKVSHTREFRGAWVTTVWNSDFPSKPGLSTEEQKAELINILNQLQSLNFNALILQVRPEGDALYASTLEPWSAWLTGTQGQAPTPFYDPLEFAIAECRKRNMECHAWFNPYRAKTTTKQGRNVRPHIAITNPECVYQWGNQLWMDPGAKIVQDRAYNVIMDVVRRYNIDGIHLDDYFYPYPIQGQSFPDNQTYATYRSSGGTLNLGDWRRENVNQMVQRLWQGIKGLKPHVKFGISPFGIYRPGQPAGITGLDAYDVLYADAKKWLEQGWVDYIAPQLYWRTDQAKQSYPALLKWWTEINSRKRHVYAGNNISQLDGKAWKDEEISKQVKISRNLANNLSLGNIFFSIGSIMENRQGINQTFQESLYPRPALVPTMSWRDNTLPAAPKSLQVANRRLSWQPGDNQEIRSWTVYQQQGETWTLQRILSPGTTFATVQPGTYAVCAVNKYTQESMGAVIRVS
ncbi:glycoside hydrolase family 10 protein [Calothrix sp. 336/3]|uniref:glycoside hydrolase family 10 protein n=1 Tax=Calothrix sp. 336/3 TaxID=1337936 RepID=UPI0004E3EABC|nr:family 10 glycosylhydrolase [Calothrix sp. 336/3]AKG23704.1 hypothetical protein IJ00_22595 [Calothrix sp. 336/3]